MRISDWSSDVCSSDLLIGQYVQGNQPDQQAPYYYNWSGQPWKTQALVRKILAKTYATDAAGYGYPGMDDQCATSSSYELSALGFYPVDRSEERRVGEGCGSTCRSRWSQYH